MVRGFTLSQDQSDTYKLFDLPFMFKTFDDLIEFQSGEGGTFIKDSTVTDDLQGLAFWNTGFKQLATTTSNPVVVPSDLNSLKIRVESGIESEQYQLLNAFPVSNVAFSEVYSILQTGVLDGVELTWPSSNSIVLDEVSTFTEWNVRMLGYTVFVSSERWAELDPDI